jgi:hypothetical protein
VATPAGGEHPVDHRANAGIICSPVVEPDDVLVLVWLLRFLVGHERSFQGHGVGTTSRRRRCYGSHKICITRQVVIGRSAESRPSEPVSFVNGNATPLLLFNVSSDQPNRDEQYWATIQANTEKAPPLTDEIKADLALILNPGSPTARGARRPIPRLGHGSSAGSSPARGRAGAQVQAQVDGPSVGPDEEWCEPM